MKVEMEEDANMRMSAQVKEEDWGILERGMTMRGGGGREAEGGGVAASATAAAAHAWATSKARFWAAAGSELILALITAQASRWPRVMVPVGWRPP